MSAAGGADRCGLPPAALPEGPREFGVEVYRLEAWRDKALAGLEAALRERDGDPLQGELDTAHKRIGELSMEAELLREKIARMEGSRPTVRRRSRR